MNRRRITFTITPPAIPLQKEAPAMSQPLTTRQERIDIACAVGIIAVLLILLGSWLQGALHPETPQPASMAHVAAVTPTCDDCDPDEGEAVDAAELAEIAAADAAAANCAEDEPCWDCSTMGNGICGPAVAPCEVGSTYWECAMSPCVTEGADGAPCYWDATQRGNGIGRSFIWTGSEVIYSN